MPVANLFPPGWDAHRTRYTLGLVSDTHMPIRCNKIPDGLFHALDGVNLLLHAGDVGELWVLDQLAAIAPVIAVHGNDDTQDAQRELPYQQIIVAGTRILLWHSHYPDWTEEMASRKDDDPRPKLARCGERALRAGATVCVFGHWHIPLTYRYTGTLDTLSKKEKKGEANANKDNSGRHSTTNNKPANNKPSNKPSNKPNKEVLIINPGALASGNEITRQFRQTAALLFIDAAGHSAVTHIDLAHPDQPYTPHNDWNAGFQTILAQYSASIFAPEISEQSPYLRENLSAEELAQLRPILLRLARRVWNGELPAVGYPELAAALAEDHTISAQLRRQFLNVMENRPTT